MRGIMSISCARVAPSILAVSGVLMCAAASAQDTVVPAQTQPPARVLRIEGGNQETAYGFSVVLLLGDMQGAAMPDNMPAAARKALIDMKDFLPYKSYKMLDTAWLLGSNAHSRLRGPDEADYEVIVGAGAVNSTIHAMHTRFTLRDALAGEPGAQSEAAVLAQRVKELQSARADMEAQSRAERDKLGAKNPKVVETETRVAAIKNRLAEVERAQARRGGQILDSTFDMAMGETVVVGTSRLKGDKALIALLTAVPRK